MKYAEIYRVKGTIAPPTCGGLRPGYLCSMRSRLLLFCVPVLLAACGKTDAPVRVDFIGGTGLTSGTQRATAGDTLTTKAYAAGTDQLLKRLTVTVTYKPGLAPITYPAVLSTFDPATAPNETTFTFADTLLTVLPTKPYAGGEYLFTNRFMARTTSGTETWTYTFTDANKQTGHRSLTLNVRNADSAKAFHAYPLRLRPVPTPVSAAIVPARDRARTYCNLGYGLVLPHYALLNGQQNLRANQTLIDLVAVSRASGLSLEAPASPAQTLLLDANRWPLAQRRATELRKTIRTLPDFTNAATPTAFQAIFAAGTPFTPDTLSTGPLAKEQVLAFRTADGKFGLLYVADAATGAAPALSCQVKVLK